MMDVNVLSEQRLRNLQRLFAPEHVAILGASDEPSKVGSRPAELLTRYGYAGHILPINPKRASIKGLPTFASLDALDVVPDVVVFAIPAKFVVEAARKCAALGVGGIIVYTSGFGEVDADGRAEEEQLRQLSDESGMVICGPNCQGIANFHTGMVANFTSALMRERVLPGGVALITQSGLVGGLMVTACIERGMGIGYLVSTGNEAGMTLADAIFHVAADERTRVIAGYVEQIRDLPRFRVAAAEARRHGKPIILLKVGRTPEAARAAASHTGSLAGAADLYDAAFREMGVIVADSLEELIDLTLTFASVRTLPDGPRLGVLTNSGGLGVFSADVAIAHGLEMATFAPTTIDAIQARLFAFGSAANPVDISTQAFSDPAAIGLYLEKIAEDPAVDILSVTFGLQFLNARPVVEGIIAAARTTTKPVLVAWVSSDLEALALLNASGIPVYSDPARAIRCAGSLHAFASGRRRDAGQASLPAAEVPAGFDGDRFKARQPIGEADALAVLKAAGLRVPAMARARDAAGAAAAFRDLGRPSVVLKVDSPDILHKSEVGGVVLDVASPEAAEAAAGKMLAAIAGMRPEARIDGVILAEMVRGEVEAFIGARWDPLLGPFVLVGLGGIFVELLDDVAIVSAPATPDAIVTALRRLKAFPILDGARGRPVTDWRALAEAAATVSRLIAGAGGDIAEIDLNPVLVGRAGEGVCVVDALILPPGVECNH